MKRRKSLLVVLPALFAMTLAGCGGDKKDEGSGQHATIAVEGVDIVEEAETIAAGATKKLNVTVTPENASNKGVTWESSAEDVATVDADGTVHGQKHGKATITAKSAANAELKDTCEVTITNPGYEYEFGAKLALINGKAKLGGAVWSYDGTSPVFNYDNTKGTQIGTSGSPETNGYLSTGAFKNATISKVIVNVSGANSIVGTVAVEADGAILGGGEAVTVTNTATEYVFEGSAINPQSLAIHFQQTSSKGFYIKYINVQYTGDIYLPAASSVTISADKESEEVGKKVTLSGAVLPAEADPAIEYEIVSGGDYATLNGNQLTGTAAGDVVVKATSGEVSSSNLTITFIVPEQVGLEINLIKNVANISMGGDVASKAGPNGVLTVGESTFNTKRIYLSTNEDASKNYFMMKTKKDTTNFGSSDAAAISYITNSEALTGSIKRVEVDITSGASASANYGLVVGNQAITEFTPSTYVSGTGQNGKTIIFNVTEDAMTYFAFVCTTTGANGQFTAIRVYFK